MYWSGRNKLGLKFFAIGLSFALALPGFSSELEIRPNLSDGENYHL